jgi:hypothetical protein
VAASLAPRLIHLQYRHQYGNTTDSHPLVTHLGTISEPGSTTCTPGTCFTANLFDSYGDSWNGNVLTIKNKGTGEVVYQLTQSESIAAGVEEAFEVCFEGGSCFAADAGGGSYPEETSWNIKDARGGTTAEGSGVGGDSFCIAFTTVCEPGKQPNAEDNGCDECEPGKHSDSNGVERCISCTAGSYSTTGAANCEKVRLSESETSARQADR